jgi:hypothetical protein
MRRADGIWIDRNEIIRGLSQGSSDRKAGKSAATLWIGDRVPAYGDFYPYIVTEVSKDDLTATLKDHLDTTVKVPREKVDYLSRRR